MRPGTLIGKYRIEELIGGGGMGSVYRVEQVDLRVPFALKILAPELAQNPLAEERFYREAVAASQVRHPHVVRVSDYGRDGGITYFVMEYLEGEDLATVLGRTSLRAAQIADLMLPICSAIAETHARGFIHRDLKPSNIFLARNAVGRVVPTLLDFGVAKAIGLEPSAALTQEGAIVGTPLYLAPEQLRRLPANARSDQYALGVMLYQCATGRLPFQGPTASALKAAAASRFPHPRDWRPDLPPEFARLILRAMNERPGSRFESVRVLGQTLLPFASAKHRTEWTDHFNQTRPIGSLTMAIAVDTPVWGSLPKDRRTLDDSPFPTTRGPMKMTTWRRLLPVIATGFAAVLGAGVWALRPHRADGHSAGAASAHPLVAATPEVPGATPVVVRSRRELPETPAEIRPREHERHEQRPPRSGVHVVAEHRKRSPVVQKSNEERPAEDPLEVIVEHPKEWTYEPVPPPPSAPRSSR